MKANHARQNFAQTMQRWRAISLAQTLAICVLIVCWAFAGYELYRANNLLATLVESYVLRNELDKLKGRQPCTEGQSADVRTFEVRLRDGH